MGVETTNIYQPYTTWIEHRWSASPTTYTRSSGVRYCYQHVRSLNENPRWRLDVAEGKDASRSYSRQGWTEVQNFRLHATSRFKNKVTGEIYYGTAKIADSLYPNSRPVTPWDPALQDLALVRLKKKLQAHVGTHQTLVPVAELRELRGLITSLVKLTTKAIPTFVEIAAGKTKKKGIRYMQDAWLTYSFGIAPTVGAIVDAAEAVAQYQNRQDHSVRLIGASQSQWQSQWNSGDQSCFPYTTLRSNAIVNHTLKYVYTGGFGLQLLSSNDYSAASTFRLGFEELPAIGWELLPFSWMYDYFFNIGEYFDDTFVLPPGALKWCTLSKLYCMTMSETPYLKVNPAGPYVERMGDSWLPQNRGFRSYVHFERTLVGLLPHVGLHLKSVDRVGSNATNRLLNLLSVLKLKGRPGSASIV